MPQPQAERPSPSSLSGDLLAALYRSDAKSFLIFFARRTFDAQAASDLVAETFAEAIAGRRRFRGESHEEARAWVWGIARHQYARYVRRGRAEQRALKRLSLERELLDDVEIDRIERLAALADVREELTRSLEQLPRDQRRAVELRVVDELPYPVVASRLAISEPAARARVSRGLRALAGGLHELATQSGGVSS
jgi:RNA polymerase sigma factor (sigma-70 family)